MTPLQSIITESKYSVRDKEEYESELKKILQPIIDIETIPDDVEIFQDLPESEEVRHYDPYDLKNIFAIEPFQGILSPYEYIMLNVKFRPPPNVAVQATVLCKVEGGETEKLILKGISSIIKYQFDKEKINFKRKVNKLCNCN